MAARHLAAIASVVIGVSACQSREPDLEALPPAATSKLAQSLEAARGHARHVWRDVPPENGDGTVNAYIEIGRGDRRKWELNMRTNARAIDRVIPESLGGYPVNYGFVPQTISYDGDPFDALVLGPPIEGGGTVRGIVMAVMHMEDENGPDSKVVLSRPAPDGTPLHHLTTDDQQRISDYFNRYKAHEPGKFSRVPGWGSADEGKRLVARTNAFFVKCRATPGQPCTVD